MGAMLSHVLDLSSHPEAASISLADTLTILAIIVAVIAIPVGVWAVRRWGNRRGQVLFAYRSTALMPDLPLPMKEMLKVEFRDLPVKDPHLLSLQLQNVGPRDVASGNFDAARPIRIKMNSPFYGILSCSYPRPTIISSPGSDGVIDIGPMLLKRGEVWHFSAIVSGKPEVGADIPLVDVDVLDRRTFDAKLARSSLRSFVRLISPLFGAGGFYMYAAVESLSKDSEQDQ